MPGVVPGSDCRRSVNPKHPAPTGSEDRARHVALRSEFRWAFPELLSMLAVPPRTLQLLNPSERPHGLRCTAPVAVLDRLDERCTPADERVPRHSPVRHSRKRKRRDGGISFSELRASALIEWSYMVLPSTLGVGVQNPGLDE